LRIKGIFCILKDLDSILRSRNAENKFLVQLSPGVRCQARRLTSRKAARLFHHVILLPGLPGGNAKAQGELPLWPAQDLNRRSFRDTTVFQQHAQSQPPQLGEATSLDSSRYIPGVTILTAACDRIGAMAGINPHVPRIYRFLGTGLGASMWFWVCSCCALLVTASQRIWAFADHIAVDVPGEERWCDPRIDPPPLRNMTH
jgi:hypothetical protein